MVNYCSNPMCKKPLHYLREGRIYVFDLPRPKGPQSGKSLPTHPLQHFWLCGPCSRKFFLEQADDRNVRIVPKVQPAVGALAS